MIARLLTALLAAWLSACATEVVELEPADAGRPADAAIDASACVCRVMLCRVAADCQATGGACPVVGGFCTGDFGGCRSDGDCTSATDGVCTASAGSTAPCR